MGEMIKDLHQMTIETGQKDLGEMVSSLREALHEPFLFVIVGEVKVGKSSFINALLGTGEEICKVAPDPCTDTVQQVMYGATNETTFINKHLKKILQPVDILKHISVVDTPGTNTISDHHQEITERFIPRSDLVVFVFEAKNPYRQSAWDFFQYIHEDWQKKVIFVLQQADLMPEDDLQVNIKGLRTFAQKKGISDPQIFALSAKRELEQSETASGFEPLYAYIKENITGRNANLLKLGSNIRTTRHLNGKVLDRIEQMEAQLKADKEFRLDIQDTLEDQQARSLRQITALVKGLLDEYDLITTKAKQNLDNGLGFFSLTKKSVLSVFSKSDSPQEWLKQLTRNLELELTSSFNLHLQDGVESLADSIAQMAKIIDMKIQASATILKPDQEIFGQISDRRRSVIRELKDGFDRFMAQTEHFVGTEVFSEASKLSPNIAAGSGIAVIGVVLATVTQITVLDLTGGILSALGLLFAGGTVVLKRGKILKGFANEIAKGREQLKQDLETRLKEYVEQIREKIDKNFSSFDEFMKTEASHVENLGNRYADLSVRLDQMESELDLKDK